MLIHETYGTNPRFLSADPSVDLEAEAADVPVSLPRVEGGIRGHEMNWIRAIQGEAEASSPFGYAAHLNEIMLLGVAAMTAGQPIAVAPDGRITNHDASILTRAYRAGWELPS
jgi:hypothetical protein